MTDPAITKRYYRACGTTFRLLKRPCCYFVSNITPSEMGDIFEFSCDKPLSKEKDTGALIKVVIDSIDKAQLEALKRFRTQKQKQLWLFIEKKLRPEDKKEEHYSIFIFEGKELIWGDELLLKKYTKEINGQ